MDAIEKFAGEASEAVVVLGKAGEFVLVPIAPPGPLPDSLLVDAARKNFHFCGIVGIRRDGKPDAKCEPDLDSTYTCLQASLVFAVQVADKIRRPQIGDSEDWLERLYRLPDTRD